MPKRKGRPSEELMHFRHLFLKNNKEVISHLEDTGKSLIEILDEINWDAYDPKVSIEENAGKFAKKYPKYVWHSVLGEW